MRCSRRTAFICPRSRLLGHMAPLEGLRVIDLTRVVAGPLCTMMLGDMGADVLKIEEPRHGDDSRGCGPYSNACRAFFLQLIRRKQRVALDLKTCAGADTHLPVTE